MNEKVNKGNREKKTEDWKSSIKLRKVDFFLWTYLMDSFNPESMGKGFQALRMIFRLCIQDFPGATFEDFELQDGLKNRVFKVPTDSSLMQLLQDLASRGVSFDDLGLYILEEERLLSPFGKKFGDLATLLGNMKS